MRKQNQKRISSAGPKGFDFGTPVYNLQLSDPTWVKSLTEANVLGCSYGRDFIPELGHIPEISLIVKNESAIKSVFETFQRWSQGSDDDAVSVNILFLNSGGYLLGISPEPDRQAARTPVPAFIDRVHVGQTWIKEMDTTHQGVREFQKYHERLIAPIALSTAILPDRPLTRQSPSDLNVVAGLRPLIKFDYSFANENDRQKTPIAEIMLELHRTRNKPFDRRPPPGPPPLTPEQCASKRRKVLHEMFSLSLFRARLSESVDSARAKLKGVVAGWQIDQAVCNLVLSKHLASHGSHYQGIPKGKLRDRIAKAAHTYSEVANGTDVFASISAEDVEKQVLLDADYLVRLLGETPKDRSLGARQSILRRRGYLGED
jgi:hypothetical protein